MPGGSGGDGYGRFGYGYGNNYSYNGGGDYVLFRSIIVAWLTYYLHVLASGVITENKLRKAFLLGPTA